MLLLSDIGQLQAIVADDTIVSNCTTTIIAARKLQNAVICMTFLSVFLHMLCEITDHDQKCPQLSLFVQLQATVLIHTVAGNCTYCTYSCTYCNYSCRTYD